MVAHHDNGNCECGFRKTKHAVPQGCKKLNLLATNRPAQIGKWIKCGKPYSIAGAWSVGNVKSYSTSWRLWWFLLIPMWRIPKGDWPPIQDASRKDGWDNLLGHCGKSGMLVLIFSLLLWGHAIADESSSLGGASNEGDKQDFLTAVEDVTWVLNQLCSLPAVLLKAPDSKQHPSAGDPPKVNRPYVFFLFCYLPFTNNFCQASFGSYNLP
jgi:hypothetical protein